MPIQAQSVRLRRRGNRKASRPRQLFWNPDGTPVEATRITVVLPRGTVHKLQGFARLTGESTSQVIASLIERHAPDPGMFLPPLDVTATEARSLEGRPEVCVKIKGGHMHLQEMYILRPVLARTDCSVWRLFRHWVRTTSRSLLVKAAHEAKQDTEIP